MQVRLRFFALYRDRAGVEEAMLDLPERVPVSEVVQRVRDAYPKLRDLPQRVLVAVNMEYVDGGHLLNEGDEIALIPPVAGGASDRVAIVSRPIDPSALLAEVSTTAAGAQVLFLGTVREISDGREVEWLEYEAYPEMAERKLAQIVGMAREKWKVCKIAVEHRVGKLELGDIAVAVAVSAGHRDAAFEAGRYTIDTLKQVAPIWKKERYHDGEEWLDPSPAKP
jgi:molybdopterin converting factor subunit 1